MTEGTHRGGPADEMFRLGIMANLPIQSTGQTAGTCLIDAARTYTWGFCGKSQREPVRLTAPVTAFRAPPSEHMQFSLWQVAVLAILQGVTEFLPISSDGHLVVVRPLLFPAGTAPQNAMDLTIVLHMGTLGSILVYYFRRIVRLMGEDRRVLWLLAVGTLPAVVVVLVCKKLLGEQFEAILQSELLAGFMLPVTGLALLWAMRQKPGSREYPDLTWRDSLLIGVCQAAAILPGLSRSGTTISAGLGLGMTRASAATYSFLLAIPALAGAGLYEVFSLVKDRQPLSAQPAHLAIGAAISFVVGLGAIWSLERLLQRGQLQWLAWYCIVLGGIVIVWQLSHAT
jgi:undecaprenyl-diphosphatase